MVTTPKTAYIIPPNTILSNSNEKKHLLVMAFNICHDGMGQLLLRR